MTKIEKPSPDPGSDFDDFLKEQGIFEEVMASPKIKKAIKDLGESMQPEMREAFAAGWNAFVARHSSFLIRWCGLSHQKRVRFESLQNYPSGTMKPKASFRLTGTNRAVIIEYSQLIGCRPVELLNRFLEGLFGSAIQ
jgi:hypothetical protein